MEDALEQLADQMERSLTEEQKLERDVQLLKSYISTPQGWAVLAASIHKSNTPGAKEKCITIFNQIAEYTTVKELKENFVKQLVDQLNDSLAKLEGK